MHDFTFKYGYSLRLIFRFAIQQLRKSIRPKYLTFKAPLTLLPPVE